MDNRFRGASSHSTAHGEQFSIKRGTNASSVGAPGPAIAADFEGYIPEMGHTKDDKAYQDFTLVNMACKNLANFNLAPMGAMLMSGWESHANKDRILLTKGALNIEFDIVLKTKRGAIFCAILKPRTKSAEAELEVVDTSGAEVKMTYDRAHELLGHMWERATRTTAKNLGWILVPGSG